MLDVHAQVTQVIQNVAMVNVMKVKNHIVLLIAVVQKAMFQIVLMMIAVQKTGLVMGMQTVKIKHMDVI